MTAAAGGSRVHGAPGLLLAILCATCAAQDAEPLQPGDQPSAAEVTPPPAGATIAADSGTASDAAIARRLRQLYGVVDDLSGIEVTVTAGVVELAGEVPSRAAHEQAREFAERIANVVEVQDRIVESSDLGTRVAATLDRLKLQGFALLGRLPLLAVALLVAGLFWWLAALIAASALLKRAFRRNPFLGDLARQVTRLAVTLAGVVLALQILDASRLLTTILGAAGVAGLALGFALRDTVENYIASLLLSLRQPFASDDHVVIEGFEGRVVRLTPRATILLTLDGNHVRIPNAKVYKAIIVNYTANPNRRFEFEVGVSTEQNLADAQKLAASTLVAMKGVLDEPPPFCRIETLGDSNVILRVFGWVDQSSVDFLKVRSEAIRLVKRAFDSAGVVMPEPIYNLRMNTAAPADAFPHRAEAGSGRKGARPTVASEPDNAIDIDRKADLDHQVERDRRNLESEDLLSSHAPRE